MTRFPAFVMCMLLSLVSRGQRTYTDFSVLATGDWYQVAVTGPGIYRVDAALLGRLGVNLPVSSASIRLFGNGGGMLPEDNAALRPDDLLENAIWVDDGGDGSFSGTDYFLFHAEGPDKWVKDSINTRFRFFKNLYAGESFYYLSFGGQGLRVQTQPDIAIADQLIDRFDERYAHELDSLNFLSSGKQWFGEEFGTGPGRTSSRTFNIALTGLVPNTPVTVTSEVIARSAGQPARMDVSLNNGFLHRHVPPALPGVLYEPIATPSSATSIVNLAEGRLQLSFAFTPGSVNAQAWLDRFLLFCTRMLDMNGLSQLRFRHWNGVAAGRKAEYLIRNTTPDTRVWDVTDPLRPVAMTVTTAAAQSRFRNDCSLVREYMAFSGSSFPAPRTVGKIANQNLHRPQPAGMLIVTTTTRLDEAGRLAEYHRRRDGIISVVADLRQIYHEFSSGSPDPAAIRDLVKMYHDRARSDSTKRPRFLLLFGDATFDYRYRVHENMGYVHSWQSSGSLDPLNTHTSDDFYGLLDDDEDINDLLQPGRIDIGIGRVPASSPAEARTMVDKIIRYHEPVSLGPWRSHLSFVADDEDQNLHLTDAELHAAAIEGIAPVWNIGKTYLDAYRQESGAGGSRYPLVNSAINSRIFNGTLIWNYSGHGGSKRLAQEAILDEDMVDAWRNENRLPLFVTATCDFAPYDNPLERSIGEKLLMSRPSGAIALMTTTRLVFAFSNRVMNNNYLRAAFQPLPDGSYRALGDAVREAKNYTLQTSGDVVNNRKFTLLGDPAMTLGFPSLRVRPTAINGLPVNAFTDTLRALNRYTISGEVTDRNGQFLSGFNGHAYSSVFDKAQTLTTLANDPGSQATSFTVRQNLLYNGKVRVVDGRFSFSFVVPKDINYNTGKGKLSFYAEDGSREGNGYLNDVYIGGLGNAVADDGAGPSIRAFLNDEKFVNGSITGERPVLIIRLSDSTGINTAGTGIGHDITAVVDGNTRETILLNDFFESDPDRPNSGIVRFQLPAFEEGYHQILIRAWDVFNNSNEYLLEFRVVKKQELTLQHVLNYPNPFTTQTRFLFEHNRAGEDLQVTIQILTITGKTVKTISRTIRSDGNRSDEMEWDGLDDHGARLGRGVYLYRLRVRTSDGRSVEKIEKLAIL